MSYKPILAGVLLLLALGTANAQQHHRVLWVGCDQSATENLYDALHGTTLPSLEFPEGTPLEEFVDFLRDETGVDIQTDFSALDDLGIAPDEPINVRLRDAKLGAALRLVLEPLELAYVVRNDKLVITSNDEALATLSVAVYPVDDLLAENDYDSLTTLITSTVATSSWSENGKGDAEIWPYHQRGVLVVSQTTSGHEMIGSLLRSLRSLPVAEQSSPTQQGDAKASRGMGGTGGGFGGGPF